MHQKLLFDVHDTDAVLAEIDAIVAARAPHEIGAESDRTEEELRVMMSGVVSAGSLLRGAVASEIVELARDDLGDVLGLYEFEAVLREVEMAARIDPEKMAVALVLTRQLKATALQLAEALDCVVQAGETWGEEHDILHPRSSKESGETLVNQLSNELIHHGAYEVGIADIYRDLGADIRRQEIPPKA